MTNFTTTAVQYEKDISYPKIMVDPEKGMLVLMLRDNEGYVLHVGEERTFNLTESWTHFNMDLMEDYNGTITFKCGDARDEINN